MIALITGKLIKKSPDELILDVNGVGYRIHVPLSSYCALPDTENPVTLHIHTHVREDAFKLFGFLTQQEQFLFEKLISISKIGPKLALNILSGIPSEELKAAITRSDISKLSSIPGVGKKTAERMVIELKDKMGIPAVSIVNSLNSSQNNLVDDTVSALMNLGFPKEKAEQSISSIFGSKKEKDWKIEDLIKETLKILV